MFRFFILLIFIVLNISISFAYIDPGTGGYIISSIWTAVVGFLAIVFGIILRFFKYTLKNFIKKNKITSVIIVIIFLIGFGFLIKYIYYPSELKSQIIEYDSNLNGVQFYDKEKSFGGYKLYEGKLIDSNGKLIRKWDYNYLSILDKEGNYYAQNGYEGASFGKFNFDGKPIWIKNIPIHHEITFDLDGNVIVLTKKTHIYRGRNVEFDVLLVLNSTNGKILDSWSTWKNLANLKKFHKPLELESSPNIILPDKDKKNMSIWGGEYDYYHMNAVSVIPKNSLQNFHKAFTPGNFLISFRHGSMLFIIDKDSKKVLWSAIYDIIPDNLEGQHSPKMLKNGNILVFDNGRYRGWSRILEINPINLSIISEYKPNDFFTFSQGYIEILPNKNLLITQSENGYVFELDENRQKVWEFYYPESFEESDGRVIRKPIYRMYNYNESFINKLIK